MAKFFWKTWSKSLRCRFVYVVFSPSVSYTPSSPFKKTQISHRVWDFLKRRTHDKKISGRGRVQAEEKSGPGEQLDEKMQSLIFGPGKAEIGLGTAIFGISVKNDRVYRNSRPNPCPGDPFRDRLKMVVVVEGDGRWWPVGVEAGGRWWKVLEGGGTWW